MIEDLFFLHDAGTGKLVIISLEGSHQHEEDVMNEAERQGMRWGDVSWGTVSELLDKRNLKLKGDVNEWQKRAGVVYENEAKEIDLVDKQRFIMAYVLARAAARPDAIDEELIVEAAKHVWDLIEAEG